MDAALIVAAVIAFLCAYLGLRVKAGARRIVSRSNDTPKAWDAWWRLYDD